APLVQVSSVTGMGIDTFKQVLDDKVKAHSFQEEFGPFRLAVDRIFSMKGFGTVITGTSLSGRISIGDEVAFYPHGKLAKIRGIQVHGNEVKMVEAGHRTAINLQGLEKEDIHRGDVAATPDSLTPSTLLDVDFHYLEGNTRDLKNRNEVRVHVGTREVIGKIILLESDTVTPGEDTAAQLILKEPVSVWSGDHYVLRGFSPLITMGGGVILNSGPRKRKRAQEKDKQRNKAHWQIYRNGSDEERLLLFLNEAGFAGLTADQLSTRLGIFGKKMKKFLQLPVSSGKIVVVESDRQRLISAEIQEQGVREILAVIEQYHRDNPLKGGIIKEELRSRVVAKIDAKLFAHILAHLAKKEEIVIDQAEIRLSSHEVTLQVDEKQLREDILALYKKSGLQPANLKDVLAHFPEFTEKQIRPVLDILLQEEKLIKVSEILYFEAGVINDLRERLIAHLRKEGEIDAPGFKDLTGLTRKFFIPILEYFDRIKLTVRLEDKRVLRKG
ncbi:MAG: SelB C-terminal domain-containing protein, partial [Desulfobulbaceae bacterium]|nr:SelB C-terminal domain-containing protein [Desulfobulbaceae bacterium]